MSGASRRKGNVGELEVRRIYERYGFSVRGLEGSGDHLVIGHGVVLHSESKRCETARPWAWSAQAESECPVGAVPVVAFRRSRSPWYGLVQLDPLAALIAGVR